MIISSNNLKISNILDKLRESELFWVLSFSILTAISAQISIPIRPVPFTLQTFIVLLAGAFLGAKNGTYSQIIYILMGIVGLPVFAQTADGTIGIARLFGPTGGYLIAFPIAAFIVGYLTEKSQKYLSIVLSMFAAEMLILYIGTLYLYLTYLHIFIKALEAGATIFTIWMVIKVFVAATIYYSALKKFPRLP
jgi:biotin transport system substrate-specific component